jgi:hypothetical protein
MSLILGAKVNSATGGTITNLAGYTVHTFTTSGTFTPSTTGVVEALVVGAGGGGATGLYSAGGGAGSVLYSKFVPVVAGVGCTVTIGNGGPTVSPAPAGGTTIFYYGGPPAPGTNITAAGGGGGGAAGGNGGSVPTGSGGGGGGSPSGSNGGTGGTGAGIPGYGFPGGSPGPGPIAGGGGGGGAGGAGVSGASSQGTFGGPGLTYTISGSSITYGPGGRGIGPGRSPTSTPGNYGSGGNANDGPAPNTPFDGTQGVVIIRYLT